MIEKLKEARLRRFERRLKKELDGCSDLEVQNFTEYLPSLAIQLLRETYDFAPYMCYTIDKRREAYKAILHYLQKMHDTETYASPLRLKRVIGSSATTRIIIKIDDILSKEALDLRRTLSSKKPDVLDKMRANLKRDKKELWDKIGRFLDSEDLGLAVIFDGKFFSIADLDKYINLQSDPVLKQKAIQEQDKLLRFKTALRDKALELYENFVVNGEVPEEKDFRLPKDSSISYKLSFIEDRLVSRVMAFANSKMLEEASDIDFSQKDSSVRSDTSKQARPSISPRLKAVIRKIISLSSIKSALYQSKGILFKGKERANIERVKRQLLQALESKDADKYFKGNWHSCKKGKSFYAMAVEVVAKALQQGDFNKEQVTDEFIAQMKSQSEHEPYKIRAAKIVINRVLAAFEKLNAGAQNNRKNTNQEKSKLDKNSDRKSFILWGAGGFVAGLAAFAATWSFYPGKENIKIENAKVTGAGTISEKVNKNTQKEQEVIKTFARQAVELKQLEKLLKNIDKQAYGFKDNIEQLQKLLEQIKRELSELKGSYKDLKNITEKFSVRVYELEQKLKALSDKLNKNKLSYKKGAMLDKVAEAQDGHGEIIVDKGESLEFILHKKGLLKAMYQKGFSRAQVRQAMALFRLSLIDLFRLGVLDYKQFNFKKASPDFLLAGQDLRLRALLGAKFKYQGRSYDLISYIFRIQQAEKYKMYSLDENALSNLKDIFVAVK